MTGLDVVCAFVVCYASTFLHDAAVICWGASSPSPSAQRAVNMSILSSSNSHQVLLLFCLCTATVSPVHTWAATVHCLAISMGPPVLLPYKRPFYEIRLNQHEIDVRRGI